MTSSAKIPLDSHKPKAFKAGQSLVLWSPSASAAARFEERLARAESSLRALGFNVSRSPLCTNNIGLTSGTDEEVAREFNDLVYDRGVDCIMATIGGWLTNRLLPHIDYGAVVGSGKIIVGYSDMSTLLLALYAKTGYITFHGPNALSEFGEAEGPWPYTRDNFLGIISGKSEGFVYKAPAHWTDDLLEWGTEDIRPRKASGTAEWVSLRTGIGEGVLVGGVMAAIDLLYGTEYFPNLDGVILFIDSKSMYPEQFLSHLYAFRMRGMFDRVNGIIFSRLYRPLGGADASAQCMRVASEFFSAEAKPVCWNVDLGHTEPMITIPIGVRGRLEVTDDAVGFRTIESAVL